jgi:hypothetical protein
MFVVRHVLYLLVGAILAQSLAAQATNLRVAGPPIKLDRSRILVPADSLQDRVVALAASGVRFAAAHRSGVISIYDLTGRLETRFGGRGRGPNQFLGVEGLEWLADTLFVLDQALRRVSVVLPTGRLLRTITWSGPGRPVSLVSGGATVGAIAEDVTHRQTRYGGITSALSVPLRRLWKIGPTSFLPMPLPPDSSAFLPADGTLGSDCEDARRIRRPMPRLPESSRSSRSSHACCRHSAR